MEQEEEHKVEGRRAFLAKCGTFAAVTPPAVTLMLSASNARAQAVGSGFNPPPAPQAQGLGPQGNNGFGNGGDDGVPGNSDLPDQNR